jgi:two-component system sensor histidine kinase AlgZ
MASIRQKPSSQGLPDFRNIGVVLRVLLVVNALAMIAVLARNRDLSALAGDITELAPMVEPPLIFSLFALYLLQPALRRLPARRGLVAVVLVAVVLTVVLNGAFAPADHLEPGRSALWAALAVGVTLYYFDLRGRAYSPSLTEARLMALTARIRPHFLFNSINAVLGVIRSDPKRAETALEELCDLFRVLMADNRELVPLADEMALCRQYLEIERLRLSDRLQVRWDMKSCPEDALIPPLMLQPLVENAVYHGVEPSAAPAEIGIHMTRHRDELLIAITNPYHGERDQSGNRMALANIRERLMLFFDLEARLDTDVRDDRFRVSIRIPYRRKAAV